MTSALNGLRVVELGIGPVTGMAGMILADFGAEVIRIQPPEEHRLNTLNAAPMWARGKFDLTLDLNDKQAQLELRELIASADVLITNWRERALQRKALDAETLRSDFSHLIYCHVSGFGKHGPMADIPGYEHVVAAYAGRMLMFQGLADRTGPVFSAVQVGVHAATQGAVTGVLAARLEQVTTGQGRLVETSILQGLLPYEIGGLVGEQFADQYQDLLSYVAATPKPSLASLYYHPAQAGDGRWMQFGNLMPHLFDAFLISTDLIDILADPDYEPKQLLFTDRARHEAFRSRMLKRLQDRSANEWMNDFIADGSIAAAPYQTTQQALSDPDIVANGHVVSRAGGVQLGPVAKMSKTPAVIGETAIEADDCVRRWLASPRQDVESGDESRLPLTGIRILDLSTIIAAPIGVSMLADMGADVIKVEQIGGDPLRGLLAGLGANRVNAGKRSISIDLKTEDGRSAVLKLAQQTDVLVHNFRPGVPEKLGIGYDDISADNPGIVYVQNNGYGPDGPGANRPSTHPIPGAAMGGVMYQMGERLPASLQSDEHLRLWTARLMRANEMSPDPNTGAAVATAVMLGLSARHFTGEGQQIFVDMFGANAYANADDFLDYPGKPPRPMPDEGLHGLSPTYRLYRCQDDAWIFLAIVTEAEKRQFLDTLASIDCSVENLSAGILQELFSTRPAQAWEDLCLEQGIACVVADRSAPIQFWLHNSQARVNGFVGPAHHPVHGEHLRHGPVVVFDGETGELRGAPLGGQHNDEVLREAGYDDAEIESLRRQGVLWQQ